MSIASHFHRKEQAFLKSVLGQYMLLRAVIAPGRKRLPVSLDGEVIQLRTPLRYELRPAALRFIVASLSEPA